ncbi:MAG: hypothetical protein IIA87_05495 [Nanoarchaeota archaeon]|nr:hypothetical protein [Nanoarchaeota archaeon]
MVKTVRAKEIPRLVFERIHQYVGSPPIRKLPGHIPWNYFGIHVREEEPFAHLGLIEYTTRQGIKRELGVWGRCFIHPQGDGSEIYSPVLQIVGGPVETGEWTIERGNSLSEEVIFRGGDVNLRDPVAGVMAGVLVLAYQLVENTPSPPLSYWESFLRPEESS